MDFLDFTRGPGLLIASVVFALGVCWRLLMLLRRPSMRDLSVTREGAPPRWLGALRGIVRGLWPHKNFGTGALLTSLNGYVFHIGLALVVFGYAPHIAFIQRHTGLSWPALPDVAMYITAGFTLLSLFLAMLARLTDPVLKKISNWDDKITWAVTILPMLTGMALIGESSAAILARNGHVIYRAPVALHLLMLELLLLWFPFGKLMHAFMFVFSRGATGIRFSHRGVKL